MKNESLTLTVDGHPMDCYLAVPDGEGKVPAVLVIQEIFGVNREIKRIVDLLAKSGYIGFAPNVFHRTHPNLNLGYSQDVMPTAREAATAATMEGLKADFTAAIDFLLKQPRCNGAIGAWGFCFGGTMAYLLATYPQIKAAVSFYGGQIAKQTAPHRPAVIEFTKDIKAPVFLAFGGQDQSITAEDVATIKKALDEHHKKYVLEVYADEGHGFFRHGINGESTAGARDVWPKVQKFLKENLGAPVAV
ncbi:MAG TPA: dienelactone hydrolase family protein [Candidatus Binatia bacterium]|nr:dienelactone hydrolase family protein [Candidatus Binatia bacterium]